MQWIAIWTMLLDHIGIVWFPDSPVWRVIGRLAFPIYTYYIAIGMSRTKDFRKYILRLIWLALASQLPFSFLFQTWGINVIGTFLVSVLAIYAMERTADHTLKWVIGVTAAGFLEIFAFDYGFYGFLLLLLYRYTKENTMWLGHLGLNFFYFLLYQEPIQIFSLFPTFIFAFHSVISESKVMYKAPKWIWRLFYPVHLWLLLLISTWYAIR